MDDVFHLQIETHSETRLLQTLQLGPLHAVRIVQLFDKYYFLERLRGEQRAPQLLDEPLLVKNLASGGRLEAEDLRPLLPPALRGIDVLLGAEDGEGSGKQTFSDSDAADPLQFRLQNAMARFMEQNPVTAQALGHTASSVSLQSELTQPKINVKASAATPPQPTTIECRKQELERLTMPLVYEALQRADENQQQQLQRVQILKQEVREQTQNVERSLEQLPLFQERLDALRQRIEDWQSSMELHHVPRDSLLERTSEELVQLQSQLQAILSEGLALQKVMRERQFHQHEEIALRLDCLEDMLEHVVQQRHWVYYLQQQNAFRELEQQRLGILKQRKLDLHRQAQALTHSIENIERINRELLTHDPLAVPEPVPALALHELLRLEHEITVIEADPALKLLDGPL